MSATIIAIYLMNGLDDHRYAGFKVDLINNIGQGSMKVPATLNEMYMLASQRLTLGRCGTQQTLNVTFTIQADKLTQKGRISSPRKEELATKRKRKKKKKKCPKKGVNIR